MSKPEDSTDDRDASWPDVPNPGARRYPRPGEPSARVKTLFGFAVLACGWLVVAATGLCTAGFMNLGGGWHWQALLTPEGFFGTLMFLLMFGSVPIGGAIIMVIVTRRALLKHRKDR